MAFRKSGNFHGLRAQKYRLAATARHVSRIASRVGDVRAARQAAAIARQNGTRPPKRRPTGGGYLGAWGSGTYRRPSAWAQRAAWLRRVRVVRAYAKSKGVFVPRTVRYNGALARKRALRLRAMRKARFAAARRRSFASQKRAAFASRTGGAWSYRRVSAFPRKRASFGYRA